MRKQEEKILSRSFEGKLDNFESKEERRFEQKHLKAYLKGWTQFTYGVNVDKETGIKFPKYHEVKQSYFYMPNPRFKG